MADLKDLTGNPNPVVSADDISEVALGDTTQESPGQLQTGFVTRGTVDTPTDADYYTFNAQEGVQYTVAMTSDQARYGWNSYFDSPYIVFHVTDPNGGYVDSSVYQGPAFPNSDKLTFTASTTGTYRLSTWGFTDVPDQIPADYALSFYAVSNNSPTTGTVTLGGNAWVGEQVSASAMLADADGLGVISFQWLLDNVVLQGAYGETLTVDQSYAGKSLSVVASHTDGKGNQEGLSSSSVTVNTPTQFNYMGFSGSSEEGATITVNMGITDPDGYQAQNVSYSWTAEYADHSQWLGATDQPQIDLSGVAPEMSLRLQVTVTDDEGDVRSSDDFIVTYIENVNDLPEGSVFVQGTLLEGQTLTADVDISDKDGLGTFQYQWQADGVDLAGATGDSLLLTDQHVGKTITVSVSYTDGYGTQERVESFETIPVIAFNHEAEGSVSILGNPLEGETLTADDSAVADADGLGEFRYQWEREGEPIVGATTKSYTLTADDVGALISVSVSYTDGDGNEESVDSGFTDPVAQRVNAEPAGDIVIYGVPTEGETLTVDTSLLSDADGLGVLSYRWLRVKFPETVEVGTGESYDLSEQDVGGTLFVEVTYTDGFGTQETVTSEATALVTALNHPPTLQIQQPTTVQDHSYDDGSERVYGHAIGHDPDGEGLTYGVVGGQPVLEDFIALVRKDGNYGTFFIDTSFNAGEFYYEPDPAKLDALTDQQTDSFTVTVTDGEHVTEAVAVVTLAGVNDQPDLTAPEQHVHPGNTTSVLTVQASDRDAQGSPESNLRFALSGGEDKARFNIDAVTGELSFVTAPDFFLPIDVDADNRYQVEVSVTDHAGLSGLSDRQLIEVEVVDSEPEQVGLNGTPAFGETLIAQVMGLDGQALMYHWFADNVLLPDELGSMLTLGFAEIGKSVHVEVSQGEGADHSSRVVSEITMAVSGELPMLLDDDESYWDSSIALPGGAQISTSEAQLYRTYSGALLRTPDDDGFNWWLNEIQQGRHTLETMAAGFLWSTEFLGYVNAPDGNSIADDVFLTHMYQGVFRREPDSDGYLWWLDELVSGRRSQTDVLVQMTQSNEYVELTLNDAADYLYA